MRALVFHAPHDLRLEDVAEAPLGPGEVRVGVRFGGICGTDLRIYRGTKAISAPRVIGHEFVGQVTDLGRGVSGLREGTRVAVYPMVPCGDCYACRAGRRNICVNRETIGYEIDGGFAESVVIPARAVQAGNVLRVPDVVADEEAAASEPVAAALQGIRRAEVTAGTTVLIMGGGPIGLAHVQLARAHGAAAIVVSEPLAHRRERALEHGATQVIDPAAGPLRELLSGELRDDGPEVAFVDVGVPRLVEDALSVLRKGGRCVIFAGMPPGEAIAVDPNLVHYREIDLRGSSGATAELQREVLEQAATGALNLAALVSDVLPLSQWESGFAMKSDGAGLKVLLEMAH
jgi:L-iditol 2-dehydrogenase